MCFSGIGFGLKNHNSIIDNVQGRKEENHSKSITAHEEGPKSSNLKDATKKDNSATTTSVKPMITDNVQGGKEEDHSKRATAQEGGPKSSNLKGTKNKENSATATSVKPITGNAQDGKGRFVPKVRLPFLHTFENQHPRIDTRYAAFNINTVAPFTFMYIMVQLVLVLRLTHPLHR
jgi:hypothetical protein